MSVNNKESNAYILGTDPAELKRLGVQHQIWASEALLGWTKAGFSSGMTILDLGCGPGFCTMELGYLVGDSGKVIAVDKSQGYIDYSKSLNQLHRLNIQTQVTDFADLKLEDNSLDGMYCRWALAWLSDPEQILFKVLKALKPGGKMVIHEYYHWRTHQINPSKPHVEKAIAMCFKSFEDAPGNIDVGKELPSLLSSMGMRISSTRSMSKLSSPQEIIWQWPRSFYNVYWPKIQQMGYLTETELKQARVELKEMEKEPETTLLCPLLIEIIAEKN